MLHWNFEIGVLHDFIEENEAKELKTHVRGRMQTTPYYVNSKGESSTSKVCIIRGQAPASERAHWATNFQTLNLRVKNPTSPNSKPMVLFDR